MQREKHVFLLLGVLLAQASAFSFPCQCDSFVDNCGDGNAVPSCSNCCDALQTQVGFASQATDCVCGGNNDNTLQTLRLGPMNDKVAGEITMYNGNDPFGSSFLSKLEVLDLNSNSLNGTIPAGLAGVTTLKFLDLSMNDFKGEFGHVAYHLPDLQVLNYSSLDLSGAIANEISGMTSIKHLILDHCLISGSLPAALGQLTNLEKLDLDENQLSGPIPSELGNLKKLVDLSMERQRGNMGLQNQLPSELGLLSGLVTLELEGNQLTGTIPVELFKEENALQILDLHGNDISGTIPSEIKNAQALEQLYLNANQLTGEIPPDMGRIFPLAFVDLSENKLTGGIPSEVINLPSLYSFSATNNNLDGELSPNIGTGAGTKYPLALLYLNDNNLQGTIPGGFTNFLNLNNFHIQNNNLCGAMPDLHGTTYPLLSLKAGGNPGMACPVTDYCQWVANPSDNDCDWAASYGDGSSNCGACGEVSAAVVVIIVLACAGILGFGAYWFFCREKLSKPAGPAFEQL